MMNDIVDRLNNAINPCTDYVVTLGDVADSIKEIDRLRAEVASLEHDLGMARIVVEQKQERIKLAEEYIDSLNQQLADSEATVQSLRAALEHTENTLIEVSGQVAALTAIPQQGKSEDARDAERLEYLLTAGVTLITDHSNGEPCTFFLIGDAGKIITPHCATQRAAIDAAMSAQESKK